MRINEVSEEYEFGYVLEFYWRSIKGEIYSKTEPNPIDGVLTELFEYYPDARVTTYGKPRRIWGLYIPSQDVLFTLDEKVCRPWAEQFCPKETPQ